MERICTKMMELSQAKLYTYQANYSAYLEAKAERLQLEQSREAKRRSLLRKELEWVRAGVRPVPPRPRPPGAIRTAERGPLTTAGRQRGAQSAFFQAREERRSNAFPWGSAMAMASSLSTSACSSSAMSTSASSVKTAAARRRC
ncbi:MAG: hypothetical protein V8T10_03235 [Merdibacter sp.]